MKFFVIRELDPVTGVEAIKFNGEITDIDLLRLKLDPVDRALMNDVNMDAGSKPADYLLVLEMLFRRHAQQNP